MYDKEFYRTSLNALKKYVKLGVFADEFGLSRATLSMFMKGSSYDYQISTDKLNQFLQYVYDSLGNL